MLNPTPRHVKPSMYKYYTVINDMAPSHIQMASLVLNVPVLSGKFSKSFWQIIKQERGLNSKPAISFCES